MDSKSSSMTTCNHVFLRRASIAPASVPGPYWHACTACGARFSIAPYEPNITVSNEQKVKR